MATGKTVFVVGAGASYEMGLPVGEKLKEQISDMLTFRQIEGHYSARVQDNVIYEAQRIADSWRIPEVTMQKTIQASAHMAHALPLTLSIDNYLHNHNGDKAVEVCGKLAIVRAILAAESNSSLYKPSDRIMIDFNDCSKAWLVPFMQLLSEDCNLDRLRERLSNVVFIVFNYDRCIEQFMLHAIMAIYKVEPRVAAEIVSWIEIYHPYGTVGELPWHTELDELDVTIDFGGTPDGAKLLELIKGIKTFTEGTDDSSSDIIAIRRSIVEADRIVFLGFAYHRLNMQLLTGDEPARQLTRRVFGTAYGMSNSDTQLVNEALGNRLNAPSIAIKNDLTCFKLFHEFSRTLSFV